MYTVYILPDALQEIKNLPGHVRQRAKRIVNGLATDPRPSNSLELSDIVITTPHVTIHRYKLDQWRIIYAIDQEVSTIDVIAVRKRPPYDYGDLSELIQEIL